MAKLNKLSTYFRLQLQDAIKYGWTPDFEAIWKNVPFPDGISKIFDDANSGDSDDELK